jgi:hypothetical protein
MSQGLTSSLYGKHYTRDRERTESRIEQKAELAR